MLSTSANAVFTDSITVGNPKAISLGNAVTADPPGIDSIHFNPAGLIKLKGRQIHTKLLYADFSVKLELGERDELRTRWLDLAEEAYPDKVGTDYFYDPAYNAESESEGAAMMIPGLGMTDLPLALFPLGGASYSPPGSNMTFATNVYTPAAVGIYRAEDDPGRFIGQRLSIMMLTYFSPSVAVQVSDDLAVGAAVTFNYAGVGIELPFRSPHAAILSIPGFQETLGCDDPDSLSAEFIPLCGGLLPPYETIGTLTFEVENPLALGFNIGFLWEPMSWLSVGAVYHAPVQMDLEGDFQWENSDNWMAFSGPLVNDEGPVGTLFRSVGIQGQKFTQGTATIDMEMPQHYALGMLSLIHI